MGAPSTTVLALCLRVVQFQWIHCIDLPQLRSIAIGDESFVKTGAFSLVGLNQLTSVVIGERSFTKNNGNFHVKDCPALTNVIVGKRSFCGYSTCVVESASALQTLEMGDGAFSDSSLELTGVSSRRGVMTRLAFAQVTPLRFKYVPVLSPCCVREWCFALPLIE